MEKTESNPILSLDNNYLKQLKEDINSIIVGSFDDLQIIEAVDILLEKLQNGVETEKKEGNPVPSIVNIEKEIIEFLELNSNMFKEKPYNYLQLCKDGINTIFENKYIQNGVETEKN